MTSSNNYFTQPSDLAPGTKARSSDINALAQSLTGAFNKLPDELALKSGTLTWAQNVGTVANTYLVTLDPKLTAGGYIDGMQVRLLPKFDNTGASTLNVNGLGNVAIKRYNGTPVAAGDLLAAGPINLTYVASSNAFIMPPVANAEVAAAAASATLASQAASAASGSAGTATGQAQVATNQAQAAAGSASAASTSASNAAASAAQAATYAGQSGSGQLQADWTATDPTSKAFIQHKPALATVATTGSKNDVGLWNVDNTSDANKPISIAQQAAINGKVALQSGVLPNGIDLANYNTTGFYRYETGASGHAPPWAQGQLLVLGGGGNTYGQVYVDFNSGMLASRGGTTNNSVASTWRVATPTDGTGAFGTWAINISGSSANTSSCSNAATVNHNWYAMQRFATSRAGSTVTSGGGMSSGLIVNNGDAGPACMSFLRDGDYGVNFGMDADHWVRLGGWSAGNMFGWNLANGDFTAAGNVTAYSDERLKKDWQDVSGDFVARWARVKHGTYTRIDTGDRQVGLSAQSAREILPNAVVEDKDGYLSLNYGAAAAVATIQLAQELIALRTMVHQQARLIQHLTEKVGNP